VYCRYAWLVPCLVSTLPVQPHLARKQFHTAASLSSATVTLRLFSPAHTEVWGGRQAAGSVSASVAQQVQTRRCAARLPHTSARRR
jgi:hypothetical protein